MLRSDTKFYEALSSPSIDRAIACLQLYRDLGAYPAPFREARRAELRSYLHDVIEVEWPRFKNFQPARATNPKIEAMVQGWAGFEQVQRIIAGIDAAQGAQSTQPSRSRASRTPAAWEARQR